MKAKEKKFIDKYPLFYKALCAKAHEIGVDMNEMFMEKEPDCYDGLVSIVYYPYAIDWNFSAEWDSVQNVIIEFYYEDNDNLRRHK